MVIKQKNLIAFQLYYLMIVEFLIDILHFPEIIRYVLDVNAIFLAILALPKIQIILRDRVFKYFNSYVILYMSAIVLFSLLRSTPFGRVLWAARNNYLYIIFFFCCAYTLKTEDFSKIMRNVARFQIVNVLCATYEYLVLGSRGDGLGGMFGIQSGCNGYLNNYLFIITAWAIVMFAQKRIRMYYLVWIILSSVVLAASAEIKFYYIELALIIVASLVLSRVSINNGVILLGAVILFFVAIQIVGKIDPHIVRFFSNIDAVTTYSKETYGNTAISRGTALSQVNDYFFRDDGFKNLFGYGFGYCEDSKSFDWANSVFATRYAYLGYRNLSVSMIFLETGYVGLIGFVAIFVFLFILAQKHKDTVEKGNEHIYFAQIVAILAIVNVWYDSCIRRESAYLTFFALAGLLIVVRANAGNISTSEKQGGEVKKRRRRIKFVR